MKIRKGDKVQVITGKDKGKTGEVIKVIPNQNRVIVDRVNVAKRHTRATRQMMQGGIIDKDLPIHISNVQIICASCGITRISSKVDEESGEKIRLCKKCGEKL